MRHKSKAEVKTRKLKEVISSQKRLNALYKIQREQPLIPLDKPIRYRWERYYVLRPDMVKSKNARILLEILGMINNSVVSRKKDFTYRSWKTKKDKPITQPLSYLPDKKGKELDPKYQRWFVRTKFIYPYSKEVYYNWVFTHPQYFVFRVRPYYLTHKKLVDSDLESELSYLSDKIYRDRAYRKLESFRARSWYDWDDRIPVKDQRKLIDLKEQLKDE